MKVYRDRNLQVVFGVTLMAVLGVASITPAFPIIIDTFDISPQAVGLLITVFTFPGVLLAPVLGVMADHWGRKKILIPSLFLFGIAGFSCAIAPDFRVLVLLRFLQGIGAASLGSLNVTIIGDLFSGRDRGAAMGYNASVLSVGTASYPAIGGSLAMISWRWPFLLPLFAIPVGILVILFLNNPEPRHNLTLKEYLGGVRQSVNMEVIQLFVASIVTFIILYGSFLTYYPILIGRSFGGSAFIIGIVMSIMSLTTAITSSQLGTLVRKFSEKKLVICGFILYGLAMVMIPFMPDIRFLIIPTVIFGLGHGINIPSIQTLLASLAPMEHRAAFMSVNGMVLRLGQTLGPILTGFFFAAWGIEGSFFAGAAFALAMVLILTGGRVASTEPGQS